MIIDTFSLAAIVTVAAVVLFLLGTVVLSRKSKR